MGVLHVFPALKAGGGPAGYGMNLHNALLEQQQDDKVIAILYPVISVNKNSGPSKNFILLKKLPKLIQFLIILRQTIKSLKSAFSHFGFSSDQITRMKTSSTVVFHDFRLAYEYMSKHKVSGQKIIIMPHSPTDLSTEFLENWESYFGASILWSLLYKYLQRIELSVLKKSDGLLTPTQFALEAYFPKQKDWHKHTKIYELPSGARRLEPVKSREDVRASWSSEPQTLFVGFFGRRHSHKGYDIYLEVASLIYKQGYRNIKFVTAGSGPQSDLKVPPNFIDLGYAGSELADYVNAVDVVIVPNRFSYFDLIILEAMSLGKKIIMSNAGGNKSFLGEPVIVTNIDAGKIAEAIIDLIVNDTLLIDESKVRGLYNSKYSLKSFAARHIRLAKEL